jgi:hypothetical protein
MIHQFCFTPLSKLFIASYPCFIRQRYSASKAVIYVELLSSLTGETVDTLNLQRSIDKRLAAIGLESIADESPEFLDVAMHLFLHCQEFKSATNVLEKLVPSKAGILEFHVTWHVRVFNFALVSIHNARKRGMPRKQKWTKRAKKFVSMIKTWVNECKAINMGHKLLILEAELLTLQTPYPNDRILMNAYDDVIVRSARSAFKQDAALAASLACSAVRDRVEKRRYAQRCQEL